MQALSGKHRSSCWKKRRAWHAMCRAGKKAAHANEGYHLVDGESNTCLLGTKHAQKLGFKPVWFNACMTVEAGSVLIVSCRLDSKRPSPPPTKSEGGGRMASALSTMSAAHNSTPPYGRGLRRGQPLALRLCESSTHTRSRYHLNSSKPLWGGSSFSVLILGASCACAWRHEHNPTATEATKR